MNILVFQLKRLNKLVIVFFMMIIFFVLLCFENLLEDPIDPKPKKQIVINIAKDNIERSYLQLTNSKRIVSDNYSSKLCDLSQIVQHNQNISFASWPNTTENFMDIQIGGEYSPKDCQPRFSVALLIPYRNRTEHLKMFLNFIHNYLQRQEIHYRIFVIEQNDTQKFNRGKLFNIGSKFASNFGFPCLILHDVDLIPINLGHIFACSTEPRHMCSSLDIFNYTLPYLKLFGGAVAMTVDQFQRVNGFSNLFKGWGGEDDDLYRRINYHNLTISRFPADYSRYRMLKHKQESPNEMRYEILETGVHRYKTDGLNSLQFELKRLILQPLFTHILVVT